MSRNVVRCSACHQVHIEVEPAELADKPLADYMRCNRCGEGHFVPGELLVDELLDVIPVCVAATRAS
jgi:hypothetical protein